MVLGAQWLNQAGTVAQLNRLSNRADCGSTWYLTEDLMSLCVLGGQHNCAVWKLALQWNQVGHQQLQERSKQQSPGGSNLLIREVTLYILYSVWSYAQYWEDILNRATSAFPASLSLLPPPRPVVFLMHHLKTPLTGTLWSWQASVSKCWGKNARLFILHPKKADYRN